MQAEDTEEETRVLLSILAHLFHHATGSKRHNRLGAKFVEREFEKTDRLMELYFK